MSPDRPTLRTVAERTGLHVSTVARALRRPADADATATLVHATAAAVGYRPDIGAASLRTRRSRVLGMLVHALTDVLHAIIYEAVEAAVAPAGYQLLVVTTHDRPRAQREKIELMLSRRVDGLIIADAHADGSYVDWVATLGVPYVLALRRSGTHPAVVGDDRAGGALAAHHLADLGHRRIAMLEGPAYSSASALRSLGFRETLAARGIPLDSGLREPTALFAQNGQAAMVRLLERRRDFSAVFAVNDMATLGAIRALRDAGLQAGRDVAAIGYNDVPIAAAVGLTTIRSQQSEIGRLAAEQMLRAIDGEPPATIVLPPTLVVRETTMPAPR